MPTFAKKCLKTLDPTPRTGEVGIGLKDADPNVRVQELNKLRDIQDPDADRLLIEYRADPTFVSR